MKAISKNDEMAFGKRVRGQDHWENSGWGLYLLDRKKETEFLVWTSPYIVRAGNEFFEDIITVQTLLAKRSLNELRVLKDNDFVYKGWDVPDHLSEEDLTIREGKSSITWSVDGRSYSFGDGSWKILGMHAGVGMDLVLTPFGDSIWYVGPPMDPLKKGEGWYWAFADVRGRISSGGEAFRVEGMGIHERHVIHGPRFDMVNETKGQGFTWFLGLGKKFRFLLSNFRGRGTEFYFLRGSSRFKTQRGIDMEITEEWLDPRSKFSPPSRWHITVDTGEVYLNANVSSYLRAYYPWTFMKHSNNVLYFFLSSLFGYYRLKIDGWKKVEFSKQDRSYVHTNWAFHVGSG